MPIRVIVLVVTCVTRGCSAGTAVYAWLDVSSPRGLPHSMPAT